MSSDEKGGLGDAGNADAGEPQAKPVYGIFEGGGAKGLGHIAAVKAAELNDLEFIGVAGASAGALIAALVAVGYGADEMFDPSQPENNLLSRHGINPLLLLGEGDWKDFDRAVHQASGAAWAWLFGGIAFAWFFGGDAVILARKLQKSGGFFSTERIRDHLNQFLREKLETHHRENNRTTKVPERVRFRDMDPGVTPECCSLKIIATDITHRQMVVFDSASHPDVEVAEVVAASVAIPAVFKPAMVKSIDDNENVYYADGGLVSNLPVWVFAEEKLNYERSKMPNDRVPILAFSLEDELGEHGPAKPGSLAYWQSVGRAAIFGGQSVATRFVSDLLQFRIPVPLGVTEFIFSLEKAKAAYLRAHEIVVPELSWRTNVHPQLIKEALIDFEETAREVIQGDFGDILVSPCRIAVIKPLGINSVFVAHAHNMANDADDRLAFSFALQGAPVVFKKGQPAFLDFAPMIAAGNVTGMTKYEFSQVRRDRSSAICLPLFADPRDWEKKAEDRVVVAVVSIDSSQSLSNIFRDKHAMQTLATATATVADALSRKAP